MGFEHHIRNEHNLWHYLSFMVHLRMLTEFTLTLPLTLPVTLALTPKPKS